LIVVTLHLKLKLLYEVCTPDFAAVYREAGTEKLQLEKCLKKVGRSFVDGVITFADEEEKRWKQVSMLERVGTRMPTTSNTIESPNGRLNGKTPRFNCFWGSLHRLREAIMKKTENYFFSVNHNLQYELERVSRRAHRVDPVRMQDEMEFFRTIEQSCLCGETVFARAMYRMDILCSHRIKHWVQRHSALTPPPVSPLGITDLKVKVQWTSCELNVEMCERIVSAPDDHFRAMEVECLVNLIVKDAHAYRRRPEVTVFVRGKLERSNQFALGESRSFLIVHRKGVSKFRCAGTQPSSGGGRPSELPGLGPSS
jgi:hypothetical protein